jgi:hypothetical protein
MFLIKLGQEHHYIGGYQGTVTTCSLDFPLVLTVLIKPGQEHHYSGGYQGTVTTCSLDYHVTFPFASDISDQAPARTPLHWRISRYCYYLQPRFPFGSDGSDQARARTPLQWRLSRYCYYLQSRLSHDLSFCF